MCRRKRPWSKTQATSPAAVLRRPAPHFFARQWMFCTRTPWSGNAVTGAPFRLLLRDRFAKGYVIVERIVYRHLPRSPFLFDDLRIHILVFLRLELGVQFA